MGEKNNYIINEIKYEKVNIVIYTSMSTLLNINLTNTYMYFKYCLEYSI